MYWGELSLKLLSVLGAVGAGFSFCLIVNGRVTRLIVSGVGEFGLHDGLGLKLGLMISAIEGAASSGETN
jgi:hypothetical protein